MREKIDQTDSINLREELEKYIIHWRWFVLSAALTLIAAFVYLRYAEKTYKVNTTIIVKDEKRGGGLSSELSAFADLGMISGGKSNVENEIQILSSRSLSEKTIRSLDLDISYIHEGRVVKTELYNNSPITFTFKEKVFDFDKIRYTFYVKNISNAGFTLYDIDNKELGDFSFNTPVKTILGELIVTKNAEQKLPTLAASKVKEEEENEADSKSVIVELYPIEKVVDYYTTNVRIAPTDKFSSVLDLSLLSPTPAKAIDYLNNLIKIYNDEAVADKRFLSEKTSEFIDSRLVLITEELGDVEKNVEGYKTSNRITDIPTELGLYLQNANVYEKQIIENETEIKVISSLRDFLKKSKPNELLPGNIVSSDPNSNTLINQYNTMVLERNRISASSTSINPTVIKLDDQIAAMKSSVSESLARLENSLIITKKELANKENELKSKLSQVPRQEREFRIIDRQQKVKEAIYLYLFQKREETAIALAATDLNAKVIDASKSSDNPVSPKRAIIMLAAMIIGLLIPFVVIYLRLLLDTKLKTRLDVESNTNIPFLGDVPHSFENQKVIDLANRTSTGEALRIVRTNLEFMLSGVEENKAKTVLLTSTFPKEGKTFISVNLAATVALSNKKVLLIGMDLRNPRLDDYLQLPPLGVSDYLLRRDANIDDFIVKIDGYDTLYALPAGTIPPNPAELLMDKKLKLMFDKLKQEFDYLIVDTAPVSLVTDTLLIAKHADTSIYVARANYLDKRMLYITYFILFTT